MGGGTIKNEKMLIKGDFIGEGGKWRGVGRERREERTHRLMHAMLLITICIALRV